MFWKKKPLDENYKRLQKELRETQHDDYKRFRRIHKELKKYGSGVWWAARHPVWREYGMIIAQGLALLAQLIVLGSVALSAIIARTAM